MPFLSILIQYYDKTIHTRPFNFSKKVTIQKYLNYVVILVRKVACLIKYKDYKNIEFQLTTF